MDKAIEVIRKMIEKLEEECPWDSAYPLPENYTEIQDKIDILHEAIGCIMIEQARQK